MNSSLFLLCLSCVFFFLHLCFLLTFTWIKSSLFCLLFSFSVFVPSPAFFLLLSSLRELLFIAEETRRLIRKKNQGWSISTKSWDWAKKKSAVDLLLHCRWLAIFIPLDSIWLLLHWSVVIKCAWKNAKMQMHAGTCKFLFLKMQISKKILEGKIYDLVLKKKSLIASKWI